MSRSSAACWRLLLALKTHKQDSSKIKRAMMLCEGDAKGKRESGLIPQRGKNTKRLRAGEDETSGSAEREQRWRMLQLGAGLCPLYPHDPPPHPACLSSVCPSLCFTVSTVNSSAAVG